ncbi:MAG TPA: hypothetical protein VFN30_01760 [Chitinophagaceae bacterium]|nr:hypothetical protein [Chitinophagaceae bacterium]
MIRILLMLVGIYILYKFIFEFVLPVAGAARQMNRKMDEFKQQQNTFNQTTPKKGNTNKAAAEDYIDYEEVK